MDRSQYPTSPLDALHPLPVSWKTLNNPVEASVGGSNMNGRSLSALLTLSVIGSIVLLSPPARGQIGPKVRPPAKAEIAAARSLFKRGLAVMIESDKRGGLVQANLYGLVDAPRETVFEVLSDPEQLPNILPALERDSIDVREKQGNALTYRWRYGGTLLNVEGVTSQAVAPPAAVQWILQKAFGPGNMLWRLYPEGDRTLVALALNIDVTKSGHALLRWLSQANPSQPQAFNLSHGIVCFRGLQQAAAKRAGRRGLPPATGHEGSGPLRPLTAGEIAALGPLLQRGAAGVIEQDARGRVYQSVIAEPVEAPAEKVRDLMARPGDWGSPVKGLTITVPEGDRGGTSFNLSFAMSILEVSTDMAMTKVSDGVDFQSPSGDLTGSVAAFRVIPQGQKSVISGATRFQLRRSHRLVRAMIDGDPYFGHSLNASCLAIWTRFFKLAVERG